MDDYNQWCGYLNDRTPVVIIYKKKRKEGKVEEENHITELIVMSFIGCCEAADDKKPIFGRILIIGLMERFR